MTMPAPRNLNDIVTEAYKRFQRRDMTREQYDALVAEAREAVKAFPEMHRAELVDDVAMYALDASWHQR